MENVKVVLNPNATKVHYSVQVEAKDLYILGWNFESSIQNLMNTEELSYNYAKIRVLSRAVRLHFETNETGVISFFWYFAIDELVRYNSGFENPITEDLLTLVNNGLYSNNSIVDYSEDGQGQYCSFLIAVS